MFVPNWTEQLELGGMNCTTLKPLLNGKSASGRHPSLPWNSFALATSERETTTTSDFISILATLVPPVALLLRPSSLTALDVLFL
jgi:hypothetical protein